MSTIGTRSDSSKVLLGCPRTGPEIVGNYEPDGDTVVAAGTAVCMKSTGKIEAGAATPVIGISRGESVVNAGINSVTQAGEGVPLRLTDLNVFSSATIGDVTFTSKIRGVAGDEITVDLVDEAKEAGAESVEVDGLAITINIHEEVKTEGGTTSAMIKAAVEAHAEAHALIGVSYDVKDEDSEQSATKSPASLAGGADGFTYVTEGSEVHLDESTGLATAEGKTTVETNWKYASGELEGVSPVVGESPAFCALVNM